MIDCLYWEEEAVCSGVFMVMLLKVTGSCAGRTILKLVVASSHQELPLEAKLERQCLMKWLA